MMWDGTFSKSKELTKIEKLKLEVSEEDGQLNKTVPDSIPVQFVKAGTAFILSCCIASGVAGYLPLFIVLKIVAFLVVAVGSYYVIMKYFLPIRKLPRIEDKAKRIPLLAQKKELVARLTDAEAKIAELKSIANNTPFKADAEYICELATELVEELVSKPENINNARHHLDYYLDAVITIIARYNTGKNNDKNIELIQKIHTVISDVKKAYLDRLNKLDKVDNVELDADIKLLERQLEQAGFGDGR